MEAVENDRPKLPGAARLSGLTMILLGVAGLPTPVAVLAKEKLL